MSLALAAIAVPLPPIPTTLVYASTSRSVTGTPPTSDAFTQAMLGGGAVAGLNFNAAKNDLEMKYGGGVYAIMQGYTISIGTGLNVNITAGQANVDGGVEDIAAAVKAVDDNIARIQLWLNSDGTITTVNNSLTEPSGHHAYLGSCVTSGGSVTSVDTSGVMFLKQGQPWRETADTVVPADSPGTSRRFWHRTANATYYWDGLSYLLQSDGVSTLNFLIDGGGSVITTGLKGYVQMDFAGEFEQVTMLGDQSGSIVVDIWKDTYANYPALDADSITASAVPTISTAIKSQDSTLTGWTTLFAAGDHIGFNVDSVTTIERLTIALLLRRAQ